jgi:hypothetical protein
LIGANFNAPIRAGLQTITSLSDWTQKVNLQIFDTSDPTTASSDDPAAGIRLGAQKVYRLTVTIEQSGTVADTLAWWITP